MESDTDEISLQLPSIDPLLSNNQVQLYFQRKTYCSIIMTVAYLYILRC